MAPGGEYPAPGEDHFDVGQSGALPYPQPASVTPIVHTPTFTFTPAINLTTTVQAYPLPHGTDTYLNPLLQAIPTTPSPPPAIPETLLTPSPTRVQIALSPTDADTVEIAAGRPQLFMFYADWCTLCMSMAPVMLNLESQYRERINFIYLNVEDHETKALQQALGYQLISNPHLYLIDSQGNVLREWVGYVKIESLQEALRSVGG